MVIRRKAADVKAARENRREQQIRAEGYQTALETKGTLHGEIRRKGLIIL